MDRLATVVLTLGHGQTTESFDLPLKIYDHSLAHKFLSELIAVLTSAQSEDKAQTHLQKNYAFLGWPQHFRDLPFLCHEMNHYIEQVNRFSRAEGWAKFNSLYEINCHFSAPLRFELLNEVHHHFEKMMGQVWQRSEFFLDADDETRFALIQINHLCHEIEALERGKKQFSPVTQVSFLEPQRHLLSDEDYRFFSLAPQFGQVVLHYCQTSKTPWDAFYDQDTLVNEDNVNTLKYYSAEFDILWPEQNTDVTSFKEWLKEKKREDERGLGHALLGEVDFSLLDFSDRATFLQKLSQFLDIKKITVKKTEFELSTDFSYNPRSPNYMQKQIELFSHE